MHLTLIAPTPTPTRAWQHHGTDGQATPETHPAAVLAHTQAHRK